MSGQTLTDNILELFLDKLGKNQAVPLEVIDALKPFCFAGPGGELPTIEQLVSALRTPPKKSEASDAVK